MIKNKYTKVIYQMYTYVTSKYDVTFSCNHKIIFVLCIATTLNENIALNSSLFQRQQGPGDAGVEASVRAALPHPARACRRRPAAALRWRRHTGNTTFLYHLETLHRRRAKRSF